MNIKGSSSVFSAANAVIDHLRDWYQGTDQTVSMGVVSHGEYGIPAGIWTSLPVKCKNFQYKVVEGLDLTEYCKEKIKVTIKELQDELKDAEVEPKPKL